MSQTLVLHDSDGGIDDYLSTLLLTTMENVELLGIVVTPADCYIEPAVSATRKILDLVDRSGVPVVASTVRGMNAFPPLYRRDSYIIDRLPILNERSLSPTPQVNQSGQQFLVDRLNAAPRPVTLLVTGPLTTVATALETDPSISAKIEKILWMGGALNVPGNVESMWEPGHDGTAEWNAYWDAEAIATVWRTEIPFLLCSLDITNRVPVTDEIIQRIAKQRRYPLSDFAGQCYALASPQEFYFWDVLATAYLGRPDLYELREYEVDVITEGTSQGRTIAKPGGRKIRVFEDVDLEGFYEYFLGQLM
ncbi:nucleoside hydrolase [Leptolyngbya valderiana BDU 20041]|nr:nucleoside hydrolase [Leptolyngbya valderiana BDU 20041]PPT09428.1 Inosine-uridine preferring nucleoside hydrolase [Geitlerinema sp. FC II]